MKETMLSIMQWHAETFPNATLDGQLAKYQEEQQEFVDTKYKDVEELADMFIVACGIARFDLWEGAFYVHDVYEWLEDSKFKPQKLFKSVVRKMKKNRKRTWHKENGLYKHDKGGK